MHFPKIILVAMQRMVWKRNPRSRLSHLDIKTRTFTEEHRMHRVGAGVGGHTWADGVTLRPTSFLPPLAAFPGHLPRKWLPWNGPQSNHLFPGMITECLGQFWTMPVPEKAEDYITKRHLRI